MASQDYYDVLGVSKDADPDEIKRAFRHKARKCHPDACDDPDAEEQFKKLNEAYDILSDPRKREQYDRFGTVNGSAYGGSGGSGGYQYVDFGDLFGVGGVSMADLFSAFMGGTRRSGFNQVRKEGRDLSMQMVISLEDAARGTVREMMVDRLATCEDCHGTGTAKGTTTATCPDCAGTGEKTTFQRTLLGTMQTRTPCTTCQGSGVVINDPCKECEGTGRVVDRQIVDVNVPAGIFDGQQIRLDDLGEAGIRGAASGDLIIKIRIAPNDRFERHHSDLHMILPLSYTQAALGATKRIKGLLDEVAVEIPAGVQTGDKVKVTGAGMPIMNRDMCGDLYCHIEVVVPKKLNKKQKELLRALSTEFSDSETSVVEHHKTSFDKVKDWFVS
ncbi:MAG: molecular chaperone DnaJ [Coriobacteriia bacterium]|nr:molecular chaperone DnaJ [Coriobacteriia bacterium]